jgi:hypothetical protein
MSMDLRTESTVTGGGVYGLHRTGSVQSIICGQRQVVRRLMAASVWMATTPGKAPIYRGKGLA